MAPKTFSGRRSKLDDYDDILGVKSDKEVSRIAGVSIENVRTYRLRRGIPASWRGETEEALRAKEAFRSRRRKTPRRGRRKRGMYPRVSRLDPFSHMLGDLPDRELAQRAGVTPENVRSYRKRRGIPARWRGEGVTGAPVEGGGTTPSPERPTPEGTGPGFAFRVSADVGGEVKEYVIFGADMVAAAAEAQLRLSRRHPGALLQEVVLVGETL
ncbi:MAG TPA: hypothetical protein DIU15_20820 [Deltaproteobacteria bacterium]|nr:hypothetical protein [Deltaproteobacteria bacterium]HCP48493.1 hypothetical protein [Deltaproteobacteria bacterium]